MDPEPAAREWPGWECGPLCDWMLSHLDQPADEPAEEKEPAAAVAPGSPASAAAAARAELRIDSAAIADARQTVDLIRAGDVLTLPAVELTPPAQLSVTVSGSRSGQRLRAAVWFRRPAEPGWSPVPPLILPTSGQAEFALSSVPPGQHEIRLLAWATEPGASLAAVTLPRLTFRADAD